MSLYKYEYIYEYIYVYITRLFFYIYYTMTKYTIFSINFFFLVVRIKIP